MSSKQEVTAPLVAIDFGSSSLKVMAAERIGKDTLKILGVEQNSRFACVDRGVILQSSNAGYMLGESLKLLSNRIGVTSIDKAFAVVGGRSMQLTAITMSKDLIRKREITAEVLDGIENECKENIERKNSEVAVLGLIPSFYVLDGKEQDEIPHDGQKATVVEVHYIVFVGKKELQNKLEDSFDHAYKHCEKSFVRADAHFSAFSSEDTDVLQDGCAVIDFGAQTTTLSIYKGNQYLACKVVPQGGWHITRLIEQQGTDLRYAEYIKCNYGCAMKELIYNDKMMSIPSQLEKGGTIRLRLSELSDLINQKLNEIIQPITEVLERFENRIHTIYITGGGSKMQGLTEYLQAKTPIRVLCGSHAPLLASGTEDEWYMPEYSALVGALIMGSDYRELHHTEDVPVEKNLIDKMRKKIVERTLDFFSDRQ